jgi:peptide deformylase
MALLNILHYPDPRLRTKAQPVQAVDEDIRRQIRDMFETMYAAPGIGLAATQVDFHQRLIVLDISEDKTQPLTLINPEILMQDGEQQYDEGCLSVPGFYEPVDRAAKIRVRALNEQGLTFEMDAEGLLAVCIQHEMDHLEGKLFVDYLTELKRQRIRKKLVKQQKHESVSL